MIQTISLFRKFEKNNSVVVALNDIRLTLPSKGMVFVCGRSGSGKSTFLNCLGGLDKPTSGEIRFNDLRIDALKDEELCRYRNEYIGFVFQDFALLESLTVYENVKLALDARGEKDKKRIHELLKELQIDELAHKSVTQLSAGQKQRTAVARAAIKNPKVILADEPTGNLDHKSGKIVLNYLRKKSAECLVVIVSHNMDEAYEFADRIITLRDGKVISDKTIERRQISGDGKYKIEKGDLFIGDVKELEEEDLDSINDSLAKGKVREMHPIKEKFFNTKPEDYQKENTSLGNLKARRKTTGRLYGKLFKRDIAKTIMFSIIAMILIALMGLGQMLIGFSQEKLMGDMIRQNFDTNAVLLKKYKDYAGNFNDSAINFFNEEELKDIEKNEGMLLTNYCVMNNLLYRGYYVNKNIFDDDDFGTAVTDREFLEKLFQNGDSFFVQENEKYEKGGVYLTDFYADILLDTYGIDAYNTTDGYLQSSSYQYCYVNGIINTNYKTRFSEELDEKVNKESQAYKDFKEFAYKYLKVSYTFEKEGFLDAVEDLGLFRPYIISGFGFATGELSEKDLPAIEVYAQNEIPDNKIKISVEKLNDMTGRGYDRKTWTQYIDGKTFNLEFINAAGAKMVLSGMELVLTNDNDNVNLYLGKNTANKVMRFCLGNYGVIFTDKQKAIEFIDKHLSNGVFPFGNSAVEGQYVYKLISTFAGLFTFMTVVLCLGGAGLILFLCYSSIRDRKYDIGVLKALGFKTTFLNRLYMIHLSIITVSNAVFYTFFLSVLQNLGNKVMRSGINNVANWGKTLSFDVFTLTPSVIGIDLAVILIASIIGLIIPLLIIKKIRPIEMLRSKY